MKKIIVLLFLLSVAGCSTPTKYVYLKHGQKCIVFVPSDDGRLLNFEVVAPKYEEVE